MKENSTKKSKQTSKKITNNVLTADQKNELKEMVLNKVRPAAIAEHFGVAISTVHYQKGLLKNEGVKIPSVRGRQQSGKIAHHVPPINAGKHASSVQASDIQSKKYSQHNTPIAVSNSRQHHKASIAPPISYQQLIINGTSVQVADGTSIQIAGAKSVNIGKNGELEIKF
jgi:transposase